MYWKGNYPCIQVGTAGAAYSGYVLKHILPYNISRKTEFSL